MSPAGGGVGGGSIQKANARPLDRINRINNYLVYPVILSKNYIAEPIFNILCVLCASAVKWTVSTKGRMAAIYRKRKGAVFMVALRLLGIGNVAGWVASCRSRLLQSGKLCSAFRLLGLFFFLIMPSVFLADKADAAWGTTTVDNTSSADTGQ